MGLFSKKEECVICHKDIAKNKINDGNVCKECLKLSYGYLPRGKKIKNLTKIDIEDAIEKNNYNKEVFNEFVPTKKIGTYVEFDENKKQWLVPDGFYGKKINPKVHKYSDIIEYELLEDGESITKGGLGRAVAGGFLFGGIGAIVGGVTGKRKTKSVINSLKIKITINDANNPVVYINLISSQTKSNSFTYKVSYNSAQEILSLLSIIQESTKSENADDKISEGSFSLAEELTKLKGLVENGILTQEEFEQQKSKLLNI